LHPSILDDLGLVDALRSECGGFSEREGISVRYVPRDVPPGIPKELALCLYRIAQEGLRNVAKHSGAKEARVSLTATDEGILLSIEDAGVGFSPAHVHGRGGLGLASMEERARLIGGDLSIHSQPGKGTLIEVWAPLTGRMP
jgi:signal transduction histidine kinase